MYFLKWASVGSVFVALIMWLGYNIQGSTIDENNVLQEAFYLLALGWLFFLSGVVGLIVFLIIKLAGARSKQTKERK